MRPGITKSANVADAWGQLATLYDPGETNQIVEDGQQAGGLILTITTKTVQLVFADTTPISAGHPFASGDSFVMESPEYIRRAWVKNDTAGQTGVVIMTPLYHT